MKGNIMSLNDRALNMLSNEALMNNFLESFLLILEQNKYTNLSRYWTIFFLQSRFYSLEKVKITVLSTMALKLKVCLAKATSKALRPFTKNN